MHVIKQNKNKKFKTGNWDERMISSYYYLWKEKYLSYYRKELKNKEIVLYGDFCVVLGWVLTEQIEYSRSNSTIPPHQTQVPSLLLLLLFFYLDISTKFDLIIVSIKSNQ